MKTQKGREMRNCVQYLVAAAAFLSIVSIFDGASAVAYDITNINATYGSNCKITEPLYNTTFDFNELKSDLNRFVTFNTNEKIDFNVCGTLSKKCNGKENVSACFVSKQGDAEEKQIVLGNNYTLVWYNGRVQQTFVGDKCNDTHSYKFHLIFECHLRGEPTLFNYVKDACEYYAHYPTPLACQAESLTPTECSVKNSRGEIINLLALSEENYRVDVDKDSFFVINPCRTVFYSYDEWCPAGSSICYTKKMNLTAEKPWPEYLNYGTPNGAPKMDGEDVIMRYNSDVKCNGTENYTSKITFTCNANVKSDYPEYIGAFRCEHRFIWETRLTCSNAKACTARSNTGYTFDLSSLANPKSDYEVTFENTTYTFGICSATKVCPNNAGICEINGNQTESLGLFNDKLKFNDTGSPYLMYVDGAQCGKVNEKYTTKIEFICSKDRFGPSIVENQKCSIIIQFLTSLACPENIADCRKKDYNGKTYDLEPLRNPDKNYKANISDTLQTSAGAGKEYYLNVCGPLVPEYGMSCPGGSAACLGTRIPNSTLENELGLGFFDTSLTLVSDGNDKKIAQLVYLRGTKCPTDPHVELSTRIDFKCNPKSGYGIPVLDEIIDECQYKFTWETNIICSAHECTYNKTACKIENPQTGGSFNFKELENNGSIAIDQGKIGAVNMCDTDLVIRTDYENSFVSVKFNISAEECKDDGGFIKSQIKLICNEKEQKTIKMKEKDSCILEMNYETPLICPFLSIDLDNKPNKNSTDNSTNTDTDNGNSAPSKKSPGMSTMGVMLLSLFICGILGGIMIIIRSPDRRMRIVSLFSRNSGDVRYTRVMSNEEASLLLPTSGRLSDSDEEMLI